MEKIGRFAYIEPNDIPETKNNTTQSYENYSIDVELEVKIPNRGVWVNNSAQTGRVAIEKTNLNGRTISFFGGEDDYLTTTPGSTIYKDILNGKKDRESLGITNINISYNSYFYPQVTIQFSDIRGMGLMMPHEEVYRQEQTNGAQSKMTEKFFAALFTFPSPEFILRVKGFYGKKVEYSLIVEDFHSNFNNQTGNFEATVKFIGKMYGVYTDIPMSHLLIAPYCSYGTNSLTSLWDEYALTFPDNNNVRIPTLLELKKSLLTAEKEIKETLSSDMNDQLNKLGSKQVCLNNVINAKNKILEYRFESGIIVANNVILIPNNEQTYDYLKNDSGFNSNIDVLVQSVDNYNTNVKDAPISHLKPFEKRGYIPQSEDGYICEFKKESTYLKIKKLGNNINDFKIKFNEYKDLKECLNEKIKDNSIHSYFVIDCNSFCDVLKNIEEPLTKEYTKKREEVNEIATKELSNLIGFNLTIKNVFIILMAHLWIYTELLKHCIAVINGDDSRTIKNKQLSLSNLPDIPTGIIDNSHIPPFPALKNNLNEFCYFDGIGLNPNLFEENKLIERLFIGQTGAIKEIDEYEKLKELYYSQDIINYFIPTCISDFNTCLISGTKMNPYSYVFKDNEVEVGWILFFFAMRCIQKFMMERDSEDITPKDFGKYEAYNLWLAYPQLHTEYSDIFEAITSGDYNSVDNFLNFITNSGNCYSTSDKPLIIKTKSINNNEDVYSINVEENKNMPASIGYGSGFKKYQDERTIDGINNFSYDNCLEEIGVYKINKTDISRQIIKRPYGLINEISTNLLKDWDDNIKKMTKIPEELTKHGELISRYLENKKNLYYNYKSDKSDKYKEPTWNITYISQPISQFYNKLEKAPVDSEYLKKISPLFSLNDKFTNNDKQLELFDIHTIDEQCPLFLIDDLKPEDILTTIPHNIEAISNDLLDGKKILTMPYSSKLFIGYLIGVFRSFDVNKKDEFKNKIYTILKGTIGLKEDTMMWEGEKQYSHSLYNINGNSGNFPSGRYLAAIAKILLCLTTKEDYTTIAPDKDFFNDKFFDTNDNTFKYHEELDTVINIIINLKEQGYFHKDIFGFEDDFKLWSQNHDNGGFLYFKNNLSLKMLPEGDKVKINNIEYELTGKTQCERLNNFLFNKEVQKELGKLNTNKDFTFSSNGNILNGLFYSGNFGEIYNSVILYNKANFPKFYLGFNNKNYYIKDFDNFLKKTINLIVPYKLSNPATDNKCKRVKINETQYQTLTASVSTFREAYENFKNTLKKLYENTEDKEKEEYTLSNIGFKITSNQKLTMYSTLKNLYTKHFSLICDEINKYRIGTPESELSRFYFVDGWYKDIGNTFLLNPNTLISLIDTICVGYDSAKGEGHLNSEMSFYSFMALICQKHNMLFISVPVFNGSVDNDYGLDNFDKMFKPLSYNESHSDKNTLFGPSYICYYPHQPSQHLENPLSQYENDGFLIKRDINDTSNFEGPTTISDFEEGNGYTIPAFGVEYGSQKQSIFKNIIVNMDNPQVTEVAVANQFNIANNYSKNIRRLEMEGQDLFKIYSNYSYTCKVDMMGCAQIQPLMYFQLNNIPMFRGAYQIINVEHNITPGDMMTSFKGVRINKTQIPLQKNLMSIDMESLIGRASIINEQAKTINYNFVSIDDSLTNNIKMEGEHNKSTVSANDLIKLNNDKFNRYVTFQQEHLKTNFNRLNPSLRQLIYCIALDLPEISKNLDYKLGFCITSATRDDALTNSYHRRMTGPNSTPFSPGRSRDNYEGYLLSDDGLSVSNEMVSYKYMGCAIDIRGTKNGKEDREDASIILFQHIAHKYTKYLKQLIWEVDGKTYQEKVDLIHIASLGELSKDNKGDIFAGRLDRGTPNTKTYTINESENLSSRYKDICKDIDRTYVNVNIGA